MLLEARADQDSARNDGATVLMVACYWVLVKGCSLSYHNKETIFVTVDANSGNLNPKPYELL